MNEQKILRKQLFKYIKYNIFMFIGIFVVFGIFVYGLVDRITFSSVNIELRNCKKHLKDFLEKTEEMQILSKYYITDSNSDNAIAYNIISNINNPNIICIVRDEDGEIIASSWPGVNSGDYTVELEFDEELLNKIYEIVINDDYYYRAITVDLSEITENNSGYVQFLTNVDTEKDMVDVYQKIILHSMIFGTIVSIIASISMSKRTLDPVVDMLKKENEFVQNVSHELRTPLAIIQAKQEILLSEPNAKIIDKSEDISLTLNETKRMAKLTKDLLLLSRADNKQIVLQKEEVEIDEFISNIAKTYGEIIELDNKKLELNLNYKKMISIDTNKIYQVMVILLDNSIKYTESGDTIEISTFAKDNKCVIEVKDTGIGISDEAIKHVFERFYREDKARSRETGGSGLGLSIADMIISSHGGTIKASHNGTKGTIFTIKLPR